MQKTYSSIEQQPLDVVKRYGIRILLSGWCCILLLAACKGPRVKPDLVAAVDRFEITRNDFIQQFQVRHPDLALAAADQRLKQQVLDDMINQQLIYMEASRLGYDRSQEFKSYIAEKEQELAADAFLNEETRQEPITDDLLRAYHSLLQKVVDVSFIRVKFGHHLQEKQVAGEKASSISRQWQAAAADYPGIPVSTFEPAMMDSGRHTNVDCFAMDKVLFKQLFAMNVGEISEPIESDDAFYVMKLDRVLTQQMADFEAARAEIKEAVEKMQHNLKGQKITRLEQDLRKQYRLTLISANIDFFCDRTKKMTSRADTAAAFSASEKNMPLSQSDVNTITIGDFLPKVAEHYWDSLFQRRVTDMLLEYMNTRRLLKYHALKLKINERQAIKDQLSLFLVQALKDHVLQKEVVDKITVSDADLDRLYQIHKNSFKVPAQVTIQEIFCLDRAGIDKVYALAKKTADFGRLQNTFSQDQETRTNGILGPFGKGRHGKLGEKAFSGMQVGQISEPIRYRGGYSLFKLLACEPERVPSFAEVKEKLKSRFIEEQYETHLAKWLQQQRTHYKIHYYALP